MAMPATARAAQARRRRSMTFGSLTPRTSAVGHFADVPVDKPNGSNGREPASGGNSAVADSRLLGSQVTMVNKPPQNPRRFTSGDSSAATF
ncbi:hypothetical protein THICB3180056 [Thiomonas sp. CB3]|nr:hypothetical protein THICB3180056 [Thiomonas sp. CB3]